MTDSKSDPRFLANPDVVLREEDPDGGLLFNPDTNDVKVINETGIVIWKNCQTARTLKEIIDELKEHFEQIPADEVARDTREFLDQLVRSGFIGEVMD